MDKVQKAGFTFIGMGGNTFQAGYLFHALVAAVAGPDIYNRFYGETPDKTVFDEPGLRDAIEMFRKITDQADAGWVNRQWNETTNTVIAGKTLMQIHGDWMKGQWKANKKVLGEDFGCINIPGTKALSVTVDAFGILGGVPDDVAQGRARIRQHRRRPQDQRRVRVRSRARARCASTCRPTSSTPATSWSWIR